MEFAWEEGFVLSVTTDGDETTIAGNREGLVSLAHHLEALAAEEPGAHFHLDEHNALEDGSAALVVELVGERQAACRR